MSTPLDEKQVGRAYRFFSPVYDFVFGGVFHRGRMEAIHCADVRPGDRILDVGFGTGLNLPHYPPDCRIVGIDASPQMLARARQRIARLGLDNVTVTVMDAARLDFPDASFDTAIATYVVSAVPEPAAVLREMQRVVKPGGTFVVFNHFRSAGAVRGALEDLVAPVCRPLGWKTDLALEPLLEETGLRPAQARRLSILGGLLDGWQLLRFVNDGGSGA